MAVPNMIVTLAMNATKYASGLKTAADKTTMFGRVTTTAFNLAKGALLGLTFALIRYIPILVDMGAESRKADIQLRFMLENMEGVGKATDKTVRRMAAYADEVNLATAVDDEQIKAVQKKLLVFAAVRKSADKMGGAFDRATSAAIDLAAGGFGEMEANAIKLGRMLENPKNSLDALNKAGITFTETEKEKIGLLVDSGKLFEAQDAILKSVEDRVKGLAAESATPAEKLAAAFGQIGDQIGEALLEPIGDLNRKVKVWLASPQSKQDIKDITDAFVALGEAAKFTLDVILNIKAGIDEIKKWGGFNSTGRGLPGSNGNPGGSSGGGGGGGGVGGPARPGGNQSGPGGPARITVNFNRPIDSVSAGREISRVLKEYDRSNGGRKR